MGKIFLEFEKPWWNRAEWGGVNFLTEAKNRGSGWKDNILGFYTILTHPNLLEGWVTGEAAREIEKLPENQLLSECSQLIKKAIGRLLRARYSEPVRVIRSSWYSNEHFRGTYSYRSMTSDQMNVWASDLAEPITDSNGNIRILFAGEATNSKTYSTVHAAVESGFREAERISKMWIH